MEDKFTPGPWHAQHVHPTLDNSITWRTSPPCIVVRSGAIAAVSTIGRRDDEVKANALLLAAAPTMAQALALLVLDSRIRDYLQ